jgi:hypothetical protein
MGTMFEETFEVGEILEEFEYIFAGLEFGVEFVFVEGGDIVVEFVDYGLLPRHDLNASYKWP